MTNVVQLKSDDENDRLAFIEAFNTVAARYQYLQSETTKPGPKGKNQSDNHYDKLSDQQGEALWDVIRTRAELPHQVDFKLQVRKELPFPAFVR